MLYVKRNSKNRIVAIYNSPQSDATEEVPIHSQELIAFLFADQNADDPFMQSEQSLQGLYLSDLGMIRIIEDLIDVLIDKNVITITDLPAQAVSRIQARKKLRKHLSLLRELISDKNKTI